MIIYTWYTYYHDRINHIHVYRDEIFSALEEDEDETLTEHEELEYEEHEDTLQ